MSKRKRTLACGRYVAAYLFSRVTRYDCPKARAEKRHHTSQVQQALNDKNAMIYNAAVIAGTFLDDETSMFVTLSFDEAHYPRFDNPGKIWIAVHKLLVNYIARLQRLAKRRGASFAYAWSPGIGDKGRYHIHMLVKGLTAEDLVSVWGLGNVDYHWLHHDLDFINGRDWSCSAGEINPERIAHYMINNAKPLRKVGGRLIHFSRSCVRPTVSESAPVPDSYRLEPPEGSVTCDRRQEDIMYSSFAFLSYLHAGPRKKRRRRKLRGVTP